jgi:hypothetical protein
MTPERREALCRALAHQDAALLLLHHAHLNGDPDCRTAVLASLDRLQALSRCVRALLLAPPEGARNGGPED